MLRKGFCSEMKNSMISDWGLCTMLKSEYAWFRPEDTYLNNWQDQAPWPQTENILKSKFQTSITFEVLIIKQNFNIVSKCTKKFDICKSLKQFVN